MLSVRTIHLPARRVALGTANLLETRRHVLSETSPAMPTNRTAFHGLTRVVGAVFALACSHPSPRTAPMSTQVWSDAQVLDYVLVARERANSKARSIAPFSGVLGRHNGITLVQTISTNDASCGPDEFALVVHYQVSKASDCAAVAGESKNLRVPSGYRSSIKPFCVPKILADHWPEVAPKMTPLRPFGSYR